MAPAHHAARVLARVLAGVSVKTGGGCGVYVCACWRGKNGFCLNVVINSAFVGGEVKGLRVRVSFRFKGRE